MSPNMSNYDIYVTYVYNVIQCRHSTKCSDDEYIVLSIVIIISAHTLKYSLWFIWGMEIYTTHISIIHL